MSNRRALAKATKVSRQSKPVARPKDIIYDPAGQWKFPGQSTRIPSNEITMDSVNYPVWGVPNVGEPRLMQPGSYHTFPNADYVDEHPQMKRGGLNSRKFSRSLEATNRFFTEHPFFKKHKSRKKKIYDPAARYFQDGGTNKTKLTSEEEKAFKKFYGTLPENLQTDDDTYDIRGYWDALGRPKEFDYTQPTEADGYYHAFSINPNTGEYLKSPAHPTFQHAVEEDRKIGYRPIPNVYGRNIATEVPSIADPEEQSFLRNTEGPINYEYGGLTQYQPGGYNDDEPKGPKKKKSVYDKRAIYPSWVPKKVVKTLQNTVVGASPYMSNIQSYRYGMGEGIEDYMSGSNPKTIDYVSFNDADDKTTNLLGDRQKLDESLKNNLKPYALSLPYAGITTETGLGKRKMTSNFGKSSSGLSLSTYFGIPYDRSRARDIGQFTTHVGEQMEESNKQNYAADLAEYQNTGKSEHNPENKDYGWSGKNVRGIGRFIQKNPFVGGLALNYRSSPLKQPGGYEARGIGKVGLDYDPNNQIGLGLEAGIEFDKGVGNTKFYKPGEYHYSIKPRLVTQFGSRSMSFAPTISAGIEGKPKFLGRKFPGYLYGDVNYSHDLVNRTPTYSANAGWKLPLGQYRQKKAQDRINEKEQYDNDFIYERNDQPINNGVKNTTYGNNKNGGITLDITKDEIKKYVDGGYIVEEVNDPSIPSLNRYQGGGELGCADDEKWDPVLQKCVKIVQNLSESTVYDPETKKTQLNLFQQLNAAKEAYQNYTKQHKGRKWRLNEADSSSSIEQLKKGIQLYKDEFKKEKEETEKELKRLEGLKKKSAFKDNKDIQNLTLKDLDTIKGKAKLLDAARSSNLSGDEVSAIYKGWKLDAADPYVKKGSGSDAVYSAKATEAAAMKDVPQFVNMVSNVATAIPLLGAAGAAGTAGAAILENPYVQAGLTGYGLYDATTNTIPEAYKDFSEGRNWEGLGNTALATLDLVPGVGLASKGAKPAAKFLTTKTPIKNTYKLLGKDTKFFNPGEQPHWLKGYQETWDPEIADLSKLNEFMEATRPKNIPKNVSKKYINAEKEFVNKTKELQSKADQARKAGNIDEAIKLEKERFELFKQGNIKKNEILNEYESKLLTKKSPFKSKLGSGTYGKVYDIKKSEKVVKLGRIPSNENLEELIKRGADFKDRSNIAITRRAERLPGGEYAAVMNKVDEIGKIGKGSPTKESYEQLVKDVEDLQSKGLYLDFQNPDNIVFNPATGKFNIYDLNTTGHYMSRRITPEMGYSFKADPEFKGILRPVTKDASAEKILIDHGIVPKNYKTMENIKESSNVENLVTELPGFSNKPKMAGLGSMNMANHEIKNINYFQQLLNSGPYSASQKQYIQGVINSVKKQNGIATQRQIDFLNNLKTGNFNFGKKGYAEGGSTNDYMEMDIPEDQVQWYIDNGYHVEVLD